MIIYAATIIFTLTVAHGLLHQVHTQDSSPLYDFSLNLLIIGSSSFGILRLTVIAGNPFQSIQEFLPVHIILAGFLPAAIYVIAQFAHIDETPNIDPKRFLTDDQKMLIKKEGPPNKNPFNSTTTDQDENETNTIPIADSVTIHRHSDDNQ